MSVEQIKGAQTLERGLALLLAVTSQPKPLDLLAAEVGLTRGTAYRLASALLAKGLIRHEPRRGYSLGARLIHLGEQARAGFDVVEVARPHLQQLSASTSDTVHLAVLEGHEVLYIDKIDGRRRVNILTSVGERNPARSTGIGKALLLDDGEPGWTAAYHAPIASRLAPLERDEWMRRMHSYAAEGCALDLEENEDRIRCVAAPIRDHAGRIVAALSVASAAQYMDDARMEALKPDVLAAAARISRDLGRTGEGASAAEPRAA